MSDEPACGPPGGVPRPMAVGEMLAAAITAIRQNPAATFGLSAILLTCYGVVSTAISLALRGVLASVRLSSGRTLTPAQARHVLFEIFAIVLPSYLAILAVAFFAELILAGLLSPVVTGRGRPAARWAWARRGGPDGRGCPRSWASSP